MRLQPIPLVLAGLGGIALGFVSASAWLGDTQRAGPPARRETREAALRPSEALEGGDDARRERGDDARRERGASRPAATPPVEQADAGAAEAERQARVRELGALRARAQSAQDELAKTRARLARLEKEIEQDRPGGPARTRHEYDLTPEDWKKLAAEPTVKYRVPCTQADRAPSDANLDKLGLAPEDYAVVRDAFASSAARQREALLPLCAAALGGQMEVARALNLDSCRTVIFSTAAQRAEDPQQSARNVGAFMAGDAPRPDAEGALTERVFLALVEESSRFEDELASAFGPEEAHHITFSNMLCFSSSSYSYAPSPGGERR